ncbi:MAG: diacylglycerol kinase [Clostridiaceae bacterium]|nr:diacylglycerol kinase [Clostridiaceae bacterium]
MKIRKLLDSFNYAIEGLVYSVRTQRNMRIHMAATMIILLACFGFNISKVEILIVTITITMVVLAEMVNTAIECALDATTNYYHPLVKIAKNVSAGAVLITALNAVVVGYVVFWDKFSPLTFTLLKKVRNSNPYMIFFILIVVSIATLVVKAIFGEGTPLKGGMPSGHSAIAFSISTAIALITVEPVIIVLSFILALIVAQSRVDSEVHSVLEVIFGALFGSFLTIFIYKLFT